jgi:hypothetical protein
MKCLPCISLIVTKLNLIIFILTTETKRRRGLGRPVYALKLADREIGWSKTTRSTVNSPPVTFPTAG